MSKDGANPSDVKKPEEQSSLLTKVIAFAPLLRLIIQFFELVLTILELIR